MSRSACRRPECGSSNFAGDPRESRRHRCLRCFNQSWLAPMIGPSADDNRAARSHAPLANVARPAMRADNRDRIERPSACAGTPFWRPVSSTSGPIKRNVVFTLRLVPASRSKDRIFARGPRGTVPRPLSPRGASCSPRSRDNARATRCYPKARNAVTPRRAEEAVLERERHNRPMSFRGTLCPARELEHAQACVRVRR